MMSNKVRTLTLLSGFILMMLPKDTFSQVNNNGNVQVGQDGRPTDLFQRDSAIIQTNKWDETDADISYTYLNTKYPNRIDSTLPFFNRYFSEKMKWMKDVGNLSTAAQTLLYTPNQVIGQSLGYNVYDVYFYKLEDLPFYHTTRPYTHLNFFLGSKLQQHVEAFHTQNINEQSNFAIRIKNNSSQGFFNRQKTTGVSGTITYNNQSKNDRYTNKSAFIFNSVKQDENGGITADSFLTNSEYSNRQLIPVVMPSSIYSTQRSAVRNEMRTLQFFTRNSYAWGTKIAHYNEDSTNVKYEFVPRFKLSHDFNYAYQRHTFIDGAPSTERYQFIDSFTFGTKDTVISEQSWHKLENKVAINLLLGNKEQTVDFTSGIANRLDVFKTMYNKDSADLKDNYVSNYLFASIQKEALKVGQWYYNARFEYYLPGSGPASSNILIDGQLGKQIKTWADIKIGATHTTGEAPNMYQQFRTAFYEISNELDPLSITKVYGDLYIKPIKVNVGLRNYLTKNYVYFDDNLNVQQYGEAFNILQLSVRKTFNFTNFILDNELVYQQNGDNGVINVPNFMMRNQLNYKLPFMKGKLDAYVGVQSTYYSKFKANGYTPYFNQFYVQNDRTVSYLPELDAFFNFKVKRLRMFIAGLQLQQLIDPQNNLNALGYPSPNASFQFGFNWVMMN